MDEMRWSYSSSQHTFFHQKKPHYLSWFQIINQATGEINKIAQQRIDQMVRSGGAEIEYVAPKIIKGVIEEVYKTPSRLLGNFGKEQFQKIKRKLFK